jgi:hypothetical protein
MRIPECRRKALCSHRIDNVRESFLLLTSMSCFAVFSVPSVAQVTNQDSYRNAMLSGETYLDKSYKKAALADQKAKDAVSVRKAGCKTNHRAAEANAKPLLRESSSLTEQANAFARSALDEFRLAEGLAPDRRGAQFGEALALLQLKVYCTAIEKIKAVMAANYRTPETTFALGLALVSSSDARSTLSQEGIELLGKYIKEANASGNPEAFPNLSIAKRVKKEAENDANELPEEVEKKNEQPNRTKCPMPIPGKTELPFVVSFSSAIGYNDNVIVLGRGQALPAGTAGRASVYNESSFILGRDFSLSHPSGSSNTGWLADQLSLSYVFVADTFAELPERDTLLNTVLGSYQRAFTPHLAGLLKISDQWLYTDQSLGSNLFTAQEALVVNLNARLKTLLSYYFIRTDGFTDSTPLDDPDGFAHRLELAQSWVIAQDKIDFSPKFTLSAQYGHEWDEPNGIMGQFQRNDLQGKIEYKAFRAQDQCSFIRAVTASLSETWRGDGYVGTALTSSTCRGACGRSDDAHEVLFALSISMWYDEYLKNAGVPEANRMEAYFQYRYTTRDSNVQFKGYDQNLFLASLKLNF